MRARVIVWPYDLTRLLTLYVVGVTIGLAKPILSSESAKSLESDRLRLQF